MFSNLCNQIFQQAVVDYHKVNEIDQDFSNPYAPQTIENLLYRKNWIDTMQWHMEDVVRNPDIDPVEALKWKRRIDASNQDRTDLVEYIDSYFLEKYQEIEPKSTAKVNSESPAWAIDRLSILALKIYHMNEEATRLSASEEHRQNCQKKLDILLQQQVDLSSAIDDLLTDIENGDKYMKVYKQLKMYNDPSLNPVLYNTKA
ncbi:hypothetical protein Pedsa_2106 [Pseudopedobacter saltans DSM 12145]|uniref:DUF4254 domain-containing protein n=1 Tax=Pseudopedobacter saltans (strain ATCC 51119 / DSM 12145 / JCM 21818 / CCUG 39354 / LMG 10337 / NBRC 100064 / NCIMB 13643) TaxID=762903 RepID=F0SB23_PSESL|nr:DUF4254 domain-containing protein [Pseudopedobacter saltans]ADY52658.1 hypothetical protein Pedsa_2106 [Pseudopedobacter saltans DSM 12145]